MMTRAALAKIMEENEDFSMDSLYDCDDEREWIPD